jgi:hypothetical protein
MKKMIKILIRMAKTKKMATDDADDGYSYGE